MFQQTAESRFSPTPPPRGHTPHKPQTLPCGAYLYRPLLPDSLQQPLALEPEENKVFLARYRSCDYFLSLF